MVDVRWTCSFLHEKSPTCHKMTSAGKLTIPRLNRSISHRSSFARVRQIPLFLFELSLSFAFRGVHKSPARSPDLVLITIRPTEISESLSFAAAVFALSSIDFLLIPKLTQLFKGSFLLSPFQCQSKRARTSSIMGDFNTEAFTLLALSIVIIGLRTCARWIMVGPKNFQADDYLMLVACVSIHGCFNLVISFAYHPRRWFMDLKLAPLTWSAPGLWALPIIQ